MPERDRRAVLSYLYAKRHVVSAGYESEISWQASRSPMTVTEQECLSEAAWVILSAGLAEVVVRRVFSRLASPFMNWLSAAKITANVRRSRPAALKVFSHEGKIDAIFGFVDHVFREGHLAIIQGILQQGPEYLRQFAFFGPVTSLHLAKNLGFQVAKPDRHLVRWAEITGFRSAEELCVRVGAFVGEDPGVVDLVLWRYASLRPDANRRIRDLVIDAGRHRSAGALA
jgi:hypothetical protein